MPVIAEGEPGEFRNQVVAIAEANDSAAAHARDFSEVLYFFRLGDGAGADHVGSDSVGTRGL